MWFVLDGRWKICIGSADGFVSDIIAEGRRFCFLLLVGIQTHALLHNAKRQVSGAILSGTLAEMQKSWNIKGT